MMKSICFFSNGHNGDIVMSKSFIQDIATQLDIPCIYHHKNNYKVSQDLITPLCQIIPPHYNYFYKFSENKSIFFINTWLHPYIVEKMISNVTIESHYKVYEYICEKINQVFGKNIKLKSIENYLPFVNYDFVNTKVIDDYISQNKNKKVLICNGPGLSNQSPYNGDMYSIIENLSLKYKDITFIATQKFDTKNENIHFTDDITFRSDCDLNEVSYLSKFCNLIIGRNSGPYVFSWTKENLHDQDKIFYCFGYEGRKEDCFYLNLDLESKSIYDTFISLSQIQNSIDKIIYENLV